MTATTMTRRDALKATATFGATASLAGVVSAVQVVAGPAAQSEPPRPTTSPRWCQEPLDRAMIDWLAISETAQVLDVGCGKGNHVQLFAERVQRGKVTAVDLSEKVISDLKARFTGSELASRVRPVVADALAMPLEPASFDLAWSSHTMHILRDPVAGVRALTRVCKPGGRVAVREDGFSSNLLPLDVGVGEPGLESRVEAAFAKWFVADRLKRGRVPFGWAHVLRLAGIRDIQTFSFLFQVSPPFTMMQAEYLRDNLRGCADLEHLDQADKDVILRITDANSPDDVFKRDDLHYTDVATIYAGVV